ncbi:RC-LH1 core complex protein PufX [Histidinibacterium aquaticum]|uniref:1-deoxy-D-xylulose-5-phosphate synthase n=1 Tax=Histidinibacterium aquaticum TaxID=2613962 RepID=A0A5J5GFA5_9RHOB|nr:RC-LH1 core complex protein PufX [Histidinibacterium aquaticum]KAA9006855.1 1-deoxy-D-xylulose-5-phosphate synthase [Histidinibacterium aquaticum]
MRLDDNNYLGLDRRSQLAASVAMLQLKGAGYAAIVVFGIWIGIAVLAWIGTLLPPDSRQTPDPVIRDRVELTLPAETLRV